VRIVDVETGKRNLALCETGEVVLRAPQIMEGYWGHPEETAEMIRDGWVYTGDIGYMDEDGYLFLIDRKKDLIKPGGFQVWPREVEEVLATHPAVADVCVGGISDSEYGEAVKAWVVLHPGKTASVDELKEHCRQKLARYKVPRQIEFRDSLPKTMVGKVLRRMLVNGEV
jgi:long-chain acyl-CoA synthetase